MRILVTSFLMLLSLIMHSQNRPKLVVAIVVDQMRYEMLDRFYNDFGQGGFKLIMDEGLRYDSCTIDYIPTYTGPGHATIFTGKLPSQHGILSNNIFNPSLGKSVYCVEDESTEPVGTSDNDSKRSPRLMRSGSLGDLLQANHPDSKTISLSIKDRGAILAGGKNPTGVYWMDSHGKMVSSTHYMQMLPDWVNAFNAEDLVSEFMLDEWTLLNPAETYDESVADDAPYESQLLGEGNTLPYDLSTLLEKKGPKGIAYTPFGNNVLTEFAFDALEAEELGKDESTDLLAVIYSCTDYIGHAFGPQSVEIQDTYLRLDQELARLIKRLNKKVGRDNYILFLSSDHGAANTPLDSKFKYVSIEELKEKANGFTKGRYGFDLIKHIGSSQIWLDHERIETENLDEELIVAELKNYLSYQQDIELSEIYSRFQVENCANGDCLKFKNAYDQNLSGDLFYIRPYGHIEQGTSFGTTHGTGYDYDSHVPLLFFGKNVNPGRVTNRIGSHQIISELQNFFW